MNTLNKPIQATTTQKKKWERENIKEWGVYLKKHDGYREWPSNKNRLSAVENANNNKIGLCPHRQSIVWGKANNKFHFTADPTKTYRPAPSDPLNF